MCGNYMVSISLDWDPGYINFDSFKFFNEKLNCQ